MSYWRFVDYLLPDEFRAFDRIFKPITLVIFLAFSFFVWLPALQPQNSIAAFVIDAIITLIFISVAACMVLFYHRNNRILYMKYIVQNDRIINQNKTESHTITLSDSYFCTTIELDFSLGKATQKKHFFVFYKSPIPSKFLGGNSGLFTMEKIIDAGGIIVPATENVAHWLTKKIPSNRVPEYPKVVFHP